MSEPPKQAPVDKDGIALKRHTEFDCPECNANNPIDFFVGEDIRCLYCGIEFKVLPGEGGKFKLRQV